jgi:hypothetical protein
MNLSNLLLQALSVIPPKSVTYMKFKANVRTPNGVLVPQYESPIFVAQAHVQPVSKEAYHKLGLDFQKEYRRVWIPKDVVAMEGQLSSDKLRFDNRDWIVWGDTTWETYDGWNELLVVAEKSRI